MSNPEGPQSFYPRKYMEVPGVDQPVPLPTIEEVAELLGNVPTVPKGEPVEDIVIGPDWLNEMRKVVVGPGEYNGDIIVGQIAAGGESIVPHTDGFVPETTLFDVQQTPFRGSITTGETTILGPHELS